jgi:hypothetical protein
MRSGECLAVPPPRSTTPHPFINGQRMQQHVAPDIRRGMISNFGLGEGHIKSAPDTRESPAAWRRIRKT